MTAPFPPEWVDAAAKALTKQLGVYGIYMLVSGPLGSVRATRLASVALHAVAPLIASREAAVRADEARRIAEKIENDNPRDGHYWPEWHDALRWAARIAREGSTR